MPTPPKKKPRPPSAVIQSILPLKPVREVEIDGVGMGVLPDGTPYLTARGLARMCGIPESSFRDLIGNWSAEQNTPRGMRIVDLLVESGYGPDKPLFHPITVAGITHHAYPDSVCMAFLEYYAYDATPPREMAHKSFRYLAKSSLKAFIYVQVGYDPANKIPLSWKNFHDRVSSAYAKVPVGYFSIFKELADLIVDMIQAGFPIDDHTVPDGSVGVIWGNHWTDENLDQKFGARIKYPHFYPDYFPQAAANPQLCWAYPEEALPEYRKWMRTVYLPDKFPKYINSQAKKRALPPSATSVLLKAIAPKVLGA